MHSIKYIEAALCMPTLLIWKIRFRNKMSVHPYQNIHNLKISLKNSGRLLIRRRLKTREGCHIIVDGGDVEIGDYCFFNFNVSITAVDDIKIGNHVQIANNVVIVDHNHNYTQSGLVSKRVIIEDDVWIGANVVILPGVVIGKGSVIAAGSVVNKDIPPRTVVAGVPAKEIKRY